MLVSHGSRHMEHLGLHHDVSNLSTMELIFVCQELITESLQTDPFVCMKLQFKGIVWKDNEHVKTKCRQNYKDFNKNIVCTIPLNINQSVLFYFPGHNALLCVACAKNYYAICHKIHLHFRHNIANYSLFLFTLIVQNKVKKIQPLHLRTTHISYI